MQKNIQKWAKAYITNCSAWPVSINPNAKHHSRINGADVSADITNHLQSIRKYIRALDMVQYLADSEVRKKLDIKKVISLATAQ